MLNDVSITIIKKNNAIKLETRNNNKKILIRMIGTMLHTCYNEQLDEKTLFFMNFLGQLHNFSKLFDAADGKISFYRDLTGNVKDFANFFPKNFEHSRKIKLTNFRRECVKKDGW